MTRTKDPEQASIERAVLESHRRRALGLVIIASALGALSVVRIVLVGGRQAELLLGTIALTGVLIGYELFVLQQIRRAEQSGVLPGRWLWWLDVAVESLFPTAALASLASTDLLAGHRALVAPAILLYPLLVILSTLRLAPWQALGTGLLGALSYLGLVAYTFARNPEPAPGSFPPSMYLAYAATLAATGVAAAAVAAQLRKSIHAAVREAESRRQLERDLEIARGIQQGLLPAKPPDVPGFEIAGFNLPADQTGGDYYDWQSLPDGTVAVTLADATGHGIGAALMAAVCRAYSRAALAAPVEPRAVLQRLNELLCVDLPRGKLVTFVLALLEPAAARIRLLSAGHGPLLVYRDATGQVEPYNAHGIPIGVSAALPYPPGQVVDLGPGDLLLLITDGFFEWESPGGEQFGIERIGSLLGEFRDRPAADIIRGLHQAVVAFAGSVPQADDLTAVIIRRNR